MYGKCENCYTHGWWKRYALVRKFSYCNENCRSKDEYYHLKNCDAQLEVDFSKQFTNPQQMRSMG